MFAEVETVNSNLAAAEISSITLDDGSMDDRIEMRVSHYGNLLITIVSGAVTQAAFITGTAAVNSFFKMAGRYKLNDCNFCYDGNVSTADTSATVPVGQTTLRLGANFGGGYLNGHIKRVAYFPVALSDANLQSITRS